MNKSILFFLGLLVGIMICALLYYFDVKLFKSFYPVNEKKEVIVQYDTVYVEVPQKPRKQNIESELDKPVVEESADEIEQIEDSASIYHAEFSFDGRDEDDVFSARLLRTRTVKVKLLSQEKQEKLPENAIHFFEIQQWSTPIKNRITYYRNQSMIKVKGMEIDHINVVFWNDAYFLEIGDRYYTIPETEHFEKLNLIRIPQ
ncbi:MAG: hypothetical protein FWC34_11405 [Bacteroidetes bacterium]|nr:hypothetical protein [Bacteroidota bacterium]MCL2302218.1 hypothetical protein [Lentimicrobiaceae bacterium]MCL2302298.1 hypothetical protein [Lentimicrobiaceae bacterium]